MTAVAGPPDPVALDLRAYNGVAFDAWINWTDDGTATGATADLSAWLARVRFGPKGTWETAPANIDTTTNATTVGRITLAATSPNMKLAIPAAVMATANFRRLHYVLEVTDPTGTMWRWAEGNMTLDRADV